MAEEYYARRDITRWAAYGAGAGALIFAVLTFLSDNRTAIGVVVGLIIAAIAVSAWRTAAPSESIARLRRADRRGRQSRTIVFCCALALTGTATATVLPDLTIPGASRSAQTVDQQNPVGLAEQADQWLQNLLTKAESMMPGSTAHVYSISIGNQSVVLSVYDTTSYQLWGLAQGPKGQTEPIPSTVIDSVAARTFAIDALTVSSVRSVYQSVLTTTKTYPTAQDTLNIVSPVSGAAPVITVTLASGTGLEQSVQANAAGSIAPPFDPSSPGTAYNVAKSLLVGVGVTTAEPLVSRLVVQSAKDGTVPLGQSPISDTGGVLLEITKAGPEGRPATIYQAPGAFPVIDYHDASTTPADALFALDDFSPEPIHFAIDDCAKRVGGNDSDMRTVALQMGSTTVNGQNTMAVQIQLGTKPGSFAIYTKTGDLLQVGP